MRDRDTKRNWTHEEISEKGGSTMGNATRRHASGMLLSSRRRTRYIGILAVLAVAVVFGVSMVLRQNGRAATYEETVLDCHATGAVAHTHGADCYDASGNLVCPLPERALHTHDDSCYTSETSLVCGQEEHAHTDACYDDEGNLICGMEEHIHSDACYETTRTLTCGQEEVTEEHVHGAGCFRTVTRTVADDEVVETEDKDEATVAKDDGKGIHLTAQTFEEKVDLEGKKLDASDDLIVRVEAPEGALPEGTKMTVKPVTAKKVLDSAKAEVEDKTQAEVEAVQAVDITFTHDGAEVEPKKAVHVSMRHADVQYAQDKAIEIVHVDDKNNADIVGKKDEQTKKDEVTFESDQFSVYAMVITTQHISSNGDVYDVTVSYGPEARIPDGSWLRVTEIPSGDAEYDRARSAVLADKAARGESVDLSDFNLAAMDISIVDPSGREIEPSATVKVDLKVKSLPEVEDLSAVAPTMEVQHHVATGGKVIVETVSGGSADASFSQATDDKVIAGNKGNAVDPDKFDEADLAASKPAVETSFDTEVFSTYTVTWYSGGNRSATVHYGYMNGNSFVEFPNGTPAYTPTFNGDYAYLIYDVEGYDYDSTHLGSATGTSIKPQLNVDGNNHQYTDGSTDRWGNPIWTDFNNGANIYVVYKAKPTPTQGGTPKMDEDETWPEGDDAPQFSKSSTNNDNDTNTVSLSIKAAEKPVEKSTPADVIVVFDKSGSMNTSMDGQTRLARAKTAVNTMANTLLNGGNHDVRMALISFSNDAQLEQGFTSNYTTYTGKVNALTQGGGTNWEKALKIANNLEVREDAATFVVFVTDGDPTFRVSRGEVSDSGLDNNDINGSYYRDYSVFGTGSGDGAGRNLSFAVDQVSAIAGANKNFYAIGISNEVTKVRNLTTQGGVDASHAFIASDSTAMENAFKSITESIKSILGFGDVEMTDGITELTNTRMEMLHSVDTKSFKYYRYGGDGNKYGADYAHKTEWTTREADGCGPASYDEESGAVEWNMGEGFQLESGVTYVVEFVAWPSQEAYDLVADLNNGIKSYDSLTDAEKSQIVELDTNPVTYALKTNTDTVKATYKKTNETGDTVSISDEHPIEANYTEGTIENMALTSMKLSVKKIFEDDLTAGEDRETEVTLVLKRRNAHQDPEPAFVDYPVPQGGTTSANIVLNDGNNWTYELYVAPGFEVDGEVLEHGYDFTIAEPDIDYHYGLIEEIINPMVVDGEDTYYGDGELINGDEAEEYIDRSLTAVNRVKSGIDIKKVLYDVDGTTEIYPDTEFTITGKLLGPDGQPYTWSEGDDVDASGAYHKYDKNGNRIVYKGHFADSSNISFTLKAGEYVRFINVPEGCTFEYTESIEGLDALGYQWVNTEAVTRHRTEPDGPYTTEGDVQPVVSGQTAKLETGVVGNKQYAVTYTNKRTIPLPEVELVKVDAEDETKLNDVEFSLYKDAEKTQPVTTDGNGNPISIKTGNKEGSQGPDGWSAIGTLPAGTYYLFENEAPNQYLLNESPVVITVEKSGNSFTVAATQDGKSVVSGPTDGVYTITVENKRASKWVKFVKVDESGDNTLAGAVFTFNDGSSDRTITSGEDGILKDGDKGAFELQMSDTAYKLTEQTAPAGYNKLTDKVEVYVNIDNTVTWKVGEKTGTATGTGTEQDPYVVTINNDAGTELPMTGGMGTTLFNILGSAIAVAAVLTYGLLSRRSREGGSMI